MRLSRLASTTVRNHTSPRPSTLAKRFETASQNAVSIASSGREHDRDARRLVILAALDFECERAERAHGLILIRALSLYGPSPPGQPPGEALGQAPPAFAARPPARPVARQLGADEPRFKPLTRRRLPA